MLRALRVLLVAGFALAGWASLALAAFSASVTVGATFGAAPSFSPVLRSVPDVEGSAREASVLMPGNATWASGLTATSSTYQWLRCGTTGGACTAIAMATATPVNHTVTAADVGSTLRLRVVGSRGGAPPVTTDSVPSAVVVAAGTFLGGDLAPTNTAKPAIAGTTAVGQTLTAQAGTWSNASSYAFQWQRCDAVGDACVDVGVASAVSTFALTAADRGARMRVRVTATNSALSGGGATATATVADTSTVD